MNRCPFGRRVVDWKVEKKAAGKIVTSYRASSRTFDDSTGSYYLYITLLDKVLTVQPYSDQNINRAHHLQTTSLQFPAGQTEIVIATDIQINAMPDQTTEEYWIIYE